MNPQVLTPKKEKDYELLDSGEGEKLERFGSFTLSRPDPQALWKKNNESLWKKADGSFSREEKTGSWELKKGMADRWQIAVGGLKFLIKPTPFKHVGLFPEQQPNWEWMQKLISSITSTSLSSSSPRSEIRVLNLFGYTGGATLACAQAGAHVVHVDGSKVAVNWARENAKLSGLEDKPIRWIIEDAPTFVRREIKRGNTYDAIIMDPPSFGHGPSGQLWKIEDHFIPFLDDCLKLLSPKPLFFLINGYSAGYSALGYGNNLLPLKERYGGNVEIGELAIEEKAGRRLLPAGIFARWNN
jgi:23S rRNA (cytosine1962-C5)-methyltransferase